MAERGSITSGPGHVSVFFRTWCSVWVFVVLFSVNWFKQQNVSGFMSRVSCLVPKGF